MTQDRAFFNKEVFPRLGPHQAAAAVPGVFACSNFSYESLADSEARVVAKLQAYFEWSKTEPRLQGLYPWHFTTRSGKQSSGACDMRVGAVAMPRVLDKLTEIAHEIKPLKSDDSRSDAQQCTGYFVSGAGTASANGCYVQVNDMPSGCGAGGGRVGFAKDRQHHLYAWGGVWKLGLCGKRIDFQAVETSAWPPQVSDTTSGHRNASCGAVYTVGPGVNGRPVSGTPPCPSVERQHMPPLPPPPPPPLPLPPAPPAPPMRLVVDEDFDGTELNSSLWNVLEQVHRGGVYAKENVRVEDGVLVLETVAKNVTSGGQEFYVTSGAVTTSRKFSQVGGRWVATVKLPEVAKSSGYVLHSSIWLTPDPGPNISGCPQEIGARVLSCSSLENKRLKAVGAQTWSNSTLMVRRTCRTTPCIILNDLSRPLQVIGVRLQPASVPLVEPLPMNL